MTDPAGSFPQFDSWPAAEYQSGLAGPFDPHTGQSFMWSDRADEAYKRLSRTITVPAGGATMTFWTSYNLELDFDYMIVEAHTVGQDDWTTLPDVNGHTTDDLSNDQACTGGWSNPADEANVLHPFLTRYQTFDRRRARARRPARSGQWNAANGASGGWQQFEIDLGAYANSQVEISITSVSDWGLQQFPGVFVDDIEVSTGEGTTSFEDDGDPMDGWTVPGAPQDPEGIEGANRNDWGRRGGLGIKEGAAVATPDTVYMGFGLEGITGADDAEGRHGASGRVPAPLARLAANTPAPGPRVRSRRRHCPRTPRLGRARVPDELRQVGPRKRPLLAAELQHGLVADGAAVRPQPLLADGGGRGHRVGDEALDDDVVAGPAVDRVDAAAAEEDVVSLAAEQHVVAGAAAQDVVVVAAVEGELQRGGRELGSALRRAGERTEARQVLREALDATARIGASGLADRAHEELVAAGARPRRDRRMLCRRESLTSGEDRVATLAAQGLSNREIAQRQFVTVKAVQWHLRNVYRKLDVSSRDELPGALGLELTLSSAA